MTLLYGELPAMVFGVPAVALLVWTVTWRVLRSRAGRRARLVTAGVAVVLTLAASAWVCLAWLDVRVAAWVTPGL